MGNRFFCKVYRQAFRGEHVYQKNLTLAIISLPTKWSVKNFAKIKIFSNM